MKFFRKNWPIYLAVIAGFTGLSLLGSRAFGAVRVYRDALAMPQTTVVLDAGHGGADGGAVSCTGARECEINLAITQRLDDLLHLLGCPTLQLRQGDTDLASADAASISEKKVAGSEKPCRANQPAGGRGPCQHPSKSIFPEPIPGRAGVLRSEYGKPGLCRLDAAESARCARPGQQAGMQARQRYFFAGENRVPRHLGRVWFSL